jgi:hypothetical protein
LEKRTGWKLIALVPEIRISGCTPPLLHATSFFLGGLIKQSGGFTLPLSADN